MQIIVERSDLLAALNRVAGIVRKNDNIPILNNLLLEADDGLSITASDLDMTARTRCAADVEAKGALTVDAARLKEIVSSAAQGSQIVMEAGGDADPRLMVKSGRSRFRIPVLPADGFPAGNEVVWASRFDMPAEVLADMLSRASFAAGSDAARPALTGVYLHVIDGSLVAAATSGFKIAKVSSFLPEGAADMEGVLLPPKLVGQVARLLADSDNVSVGAVKGRFSVTTDAVSLEGKVLDYDFVNYARAIPASSPVVARADKAALEASIRRAQIAGDTDQLGSGVKLVFTHGLLTVSGRNPESEAVDEIEVDYAGEPMTIGLNSGHALEALGRIDGEVVTLGMTDEKSPVVLTSEADEAALFLLVLRRVA